MAEGDDDEDPDGWDGTMSLIQQFLNTKEVSATQDDDFLAPIPYTAPPWWRKSENEVAGIQRVDGIGDGWRGLEVRGVRGRGELQAGEGVSLGTER